MIETKPTAAFAFPRARRLQSEAEFAALARPGPESIRLSQHWFVLTATPVPMPDADVPAAARVRFGLTVGKRLARRAVDRAMVKRVLREAARHAAPRLDEVAPAALGVHVRLKAPLPPREAGPRGPLKRALREDADALLARLVERCGRTAARP